MFSAEGDDLYYCASASDAEAEAEFRRRFASPTFDADSKMLFKVTVDEGAPHKGKPVSYVGVPHTRPFSDVLALYNRKHAGDGAFLLKGGFGVRPAQSSGQVFMKYGHELEFHKDVWPHRIAWHQRN